MHGVAATDVFWTREKLLTRRAVLWLGQTCNIRCHFCYFLDRILTKDHPEHAFMDLDKAKQICHDLRYKYGNTSIDIQGGEPTIWKHINELCRYCADIGLHPTLITNGIALYRRRNVEALKASGVRDLLICNFSLRLSCCSRLSSWSGPLGTVTTTFTRESFKVSRSKLSGSRSSPSS